MQCWLKYLATTTSSSSSTSTSTSSSSTSSTSTSSSSASTNSSTAQLIVQDTRYCRSGRVTMLASPHLFFLARANPLRRWWWWKSLQNSGLQYLCDGIENPLESTDDAIWKSTSSDDVCWQLILIEAHVDTSFQDNFDQHWEHAGLLLTDVGWIVGWVYPYL